MKYGIFPDNMKYADGNYASSVYGDWIAATWFKQDFDDAEKVQAIKDQLEVYSYLNYDT